MSTSLMLSAALTLVGGGPDLRVQQRPDATSIEVPKRKRPPDVEGGQYFCCTTATENAGESCVEATAETAGECGAILHCEATWWWTSDGNVACG